MAKRGRVKEGLKQLKGGQSPDLLERVIGMGSTRLAVVSLHPGAGGNPAFSEITAPVMRLVFYPAVIGFIPPATS